MTAVNAFAIEFDAWLLADPGNRTHERVAAQLGVSQAAISQWRNGKTVPEWRYIQRLAEMMEVDLYYLTHKAYGWQIPAAGEMPTRSAILVEIDMLLKRLEERSPDLLAGVAEVIRGLERFARKRDRETADTNSR